MSAWKWSDETYPRLEFWRGRPVGEQEDELMAREQYEREETNDGNDAAE